jgi:hypothetical protein
VGLKGAQAVRVSAQGEAGGAGSPALEPIFDSSVLILSETCNFSPQVLFVSAPCMWLRPKRSDALSEYPHYNCPMYRTAERKGVLATTGHSTNFVMMVKVPTDESPKHWILRGVCMLSQLSE